MAYNALVAQIQAGVDARKRPHPGQYRDVLCSLGSSGALMREAMTLASQNMPTLQAHARRMAGKERSEDIEALLSRAGKVCAGKHAAHEILKRARDRLVFHWDKAIVAHSVEGFGTNKIVVWLEGDENEHMVHRLAAEVLTRVLIPDAVGAKDAGEAQRAVDDALDQVQDAMNTIIEFFTAAMYGFMLSKRMTRREQGEGE
jgi:hypothetical protein